MFLCPVREGFFAFGSFSKVPEKKALTDFEEGSIFLLADRSNGGSSDETGEYEVPTFSDCLDVLSTFVFSSGL
jgi:hypothetical protein